MLNVVGGSPSSTPVPKYAPSAYPIYDSAEESYTSYDSCDSLDGERGGGSESKRRRRRNKKERKRGRDRERRARSREDSARGGGPSEKRSRRDSNVGFCFYEFFCLSFLLYKKKFKYLYMLTFISVYRMTNIVRSRAN